MAFGLATNPFKKDPFEINEWKDKKSGCQILHSLFSFTSESFRSLVDVKSGCQILHSRRERKGVNFPELQVRKVEKNDVKYIFL